MKRPLPILPTALLTAASGLAFALAWWLLGEPLREPLMTRTLLGPPLVAAAMSLCTFFFTGMAAAQMIGPDRRAHLVHTGAGVIITVTMTLLLSPAVPWLFIIVHTSLALPLEWAGSAAGRHLPGS